MSNFSNNIIGNKKQRIVLLLWLIVPLIVGIWVVPLISIGYVLNRLGGFYVLGSIPALILFLSLKGDKANNK